MVHWLTCVQLTHENDLLQGWDGSLGFLQNPAGLTDVCNWKQVLEGKKMVSQVGPVSPKFSTLLTMSMVYCVTPKRKKRMIYSQKLRMLRYIQALATCQIQTLTHAHIQHEAVCSLYFSQTTVNCCATNPLIYFPCSVSPLYLLSHVPLHTIKPSLCSGCA